MAFTERPFSQITIQQDASKLVQAPRLPLEEEAGAIIETLDNCIGNLLMLAGNDGPRGENPTPVPGLTNRLDVIKGMSAELQKLLIDLRGRIGKL